VARYREKTGEDLAWNSIRRTITRTYDMALADLREEDINDLLSAAWQEYTRALGQGKVKEVESKYKALAHAVVGDKVAKIGASLRPPVEVDSASLADG